MITKRYNGVTIWFCNKKGYGFIRPDTSDTDIFVHWNNINMEGYKTLKPEQRVSYELGANEKGDMAIDVKVLENQTI